MVLCWFQRHDEPKAAVVTCMAKIVEARKWQEVPGRELRVLIAGYGGRKRRQIARESRF